MEFAGNVLTFCTGRTACGLGYGSQYGFFGCGNLDTECFANAKDIQAGVNWAVSVSLISATAFLGIRRVFLGSGEWSGD